MTEMTDAEKWVRDTLNERRAQHDALRQIEIDKRNGKLQEMYDRIAKAVAQDRTTHASTGR